MWYSEQYYTEQHLFKHGQQCLNSTDEHEGVHLPRSSRRFFNSKMMYLRVHSAESFKYWSKSV
jgi:hypothetical protein